MFLTACLPGVHTRLFGVEGFHPSGLTLPVRADVMGKDGGIRVRWKSSQGGPLAGRRGAKALTFLFAPEAHPPQRLGTAGERFFLTRR